jgi:methylase of polypeptide subunit release factors
MQILNAKDPSRWQNKTAVELGAGTGIVACALGTLQIPGLKIWSTDLVQLLPLAKQNVALNDLGGIVEVEELAWGKPLPESIPAKPDLLLLADCIYVGQFSPNV